MVLAFNENEFVVCGGNTVAFNVLNTGKDAIPGANQGMK
jgi:hypothetical protein